ncbi:hypothetical protein KEJ25_07935 [Candidatus Bathyarchaeota archaeon]|nr:hypothetical protein [Candidatus Bathyarchaeota archaeon]
MDESEFQQELQRVMFDVGFTELFSAEKFAERFEKHFEKIGKFEELKEYVEEKALYSLLESEGIFGF